jgi:hypothetical protein
MSFDDPAVPAPDAEGPAVITPGGNIVVVSSIRYHKHYCILVVVLLLATLLFALWGLLRADHADHHVTRLHGAIACQAGLERDVSKARSELDIANGNSHVAVIGSDRAAMNAGADDIAQRVKEPRAAQARLDQADTVCPH